MTAASTKMTLAAFEATFNRIRAQMAKVVVGQEDLVFGLLVSALSGGHVLIEGAPGLGKTLVARSFARVSGASFKRIQFTPDLMPSDVTGSSVLDREKGAFTFIPGPIFCQLLLADEINRAPAKTQSALLEAMQDHQVTVDGVSRPLPAPFIVVATQNPIESQGTYPLPEAQLDRFLMKLTVSDPPRDVEQRIVKNHATGFDPTDLSALEATTSTDELLAMQTAARAVRVDDAIIEYVVELARKTREDRAIELGASPRASIAMMKAAQVVAASEGRDFVTPDDVKPVAKPVLRHRVMLHPDAELQGITADERIDDLLRTVPVPRAARPSAPPPAPAAPAPPPPVANP
jgi:MoxR-like ATPase